MSLWLELSEFLVQLGRATRHTDPLHVMASQGKEADLSVAPWQEPQVSACQSGKEQHLGIACTWAEGKEVHSSSGQVMTPSGTVNEGSEDTYSVRSLLCGALGSTCNVSSRYIRFANIAHTPP